MELLSGAAWKFTLFILVLGILVVFHELGHFLAAKLIGVRAEVFSFGFGNRLFGRRIGETDYRVSLIPLGGYVRMFGDGSEEPLTGSPREFDSRKTWEKLFIMAMGPAFNVILAVLLLTAVFLRGDDVPAYLAAPVKVEAVERKSAAELAGLRVGDVVTAIDGRPVANWEEFLQRVLINPGKTVDLTVVRDGAEMSLDVPVEERTNHALGYIGVHPCYQIIVRRLHSGAGEDAGLQSGDMVDAVDGVPPCSVESLVQTLQEGEGKPRVIRVLRGETSKELTVTPRWNPAEGKWLMGVELDTSTGALMHRRYPLGRAFTESLRENWSNSHLLVSALGKLVVGSLSFRTMSGPLELADMAQQSAEIGLNEVLKLMALISLNLGIINLAPIPLLDGGRMAIIAVEALRGRALATTTKDWILQAGLVMIVSLMAVVLLFDLIKKLGG